MQKTTTTEQPQQQWTSGTAPVVSAKKKSTPEAAVSQAGTQQHAENQSTNFSILILCLAGVVWLLVMGGLLYFLKKALDTPTGTKWALPALLLLTFFPVLLGIPIKVSEAVGRLRLWQAITTTATEMRTRAGAIKHILNLLFWVGGLFWLHGNIAYAVDRWLGGKFIFELILLCFYGAILAIPAKLSARAVAPIIDDWLTRLWQQMKRRATDRE